MSKFVKVISYKNSTPFLFIFLITNQAKLFAWQKSISEEQLIFMLNALYSFGKAIAYLYSLLKPYSSIIMERGLQTENKNELTEWHSGERLVCFASFLSDGFTIATVVFRPDKKC
jgi:hypothetical protein